MKEKKDRFNADRTYALTVVCPIHRVPRGVLCGDESPNYKALSVQLRNS